MQTDRAMTELSAIRDEIARLQRRRDEIERAPKSDVDLRIGLEQECDWVEADAWPRIRPVEATSDSAAVVGMRIVRLLIAVLGEEPLIAACVADHVERVKAANRELGLPNPQRRDELAAIDRELLDLGRREEVAILDSEAAGETVLRRKGAHWPTIFAVWEERFGQSDQGDNRENARDDAQTASSLVIK